MFMALACVRPHHTTTSLIITAYPVVFYFLYTKGGGEKHLKGNWLVVCFKLLEEPDRVLNLYL